ncbi:hypothetical protein AAH978_18665 [Streptomyces sp. ZYX-F-203]
MPDLSLRLPTLPRQSAQRGEPSAAVLLRERPSSSADSSPEHDRDDSARDDNPFSPPPEGTPDRPWQPRRHPEEGEGEAGPDDGGERGDRPPGGRQWSDRQPGRSSGGFGERPGGGPAGPSGGSGPRWDPTDPVQRRARYALLSGMWALFFALFGWSYVALLLGALALYWGIDSLRAKPRATDSERAAGRGRRPQTSAAISGLVTSSLAIALVAATFAAQLVYRDYYTCREDALTGEARQACSELLPEPLRDVLGSEN